MPMLAKLRRHLTGLATALTGSVVVAVTFFSFLTCANLYITRGQTAFESDVTAFVAQWELNQSLDLVQIQDLAQRSEIDLYLEENGTPLFLSNLSQQTVSVEELQEVLMNAGFDITAAPLSSYSEDCLIQKVQLGGKDVRILAIKQAHSESWHLLIAWQSLEEERQILGWVAIGFILLTLIGIILVASLCWVVAGRAIRPVEYAMQQQKEFVRAAGHELRTPLGVLRAGLSILPNEDTKKATRHIALMSEETVRMGKLIDQLLILSGGGIVHSSQPEKFEPDTLLLSLAEEWEPIIYKAKRHLKVNLPENNLPTVTASREEIRQILIVYIDNALQYAPVDSCIVFECCEAKHGIRWTIRDYGPGLSNFNKSKVFQRFWRADSSRTDHSHFGLGLSVAAELATRCGARIGVSDTPGGGASFWVEVQSSR